MATGKDGRDESGNKNKHLGSSKKCFWVTNNRNLNKNREEINWRGFRLQNT